MWPHGTHSCQLLGMQQNHSPRSSASTVPKSDGPAKLWATMFLITPGPATGLHGISSLNGTKPSLRGPVPALPALVAASLAHLAKQGHHAVATIRLHRAVLAALRKAHSREATMDNGGVRRVMKDSARGPKAGPTNRRNRLPPRPRRPPKSYSPCLECNIYAGRLARVFALNVNIFFKVLLGSP